MANPMRANPTGVDQALEERAEEVIVRRLREVGEPMSPNQLLDAGRQVEPIPYSILRLVIWNLVGSGRLQFTNDWRLQLVR